jgi:hypothetical protein
VSLSQDILEFCNLAGLQKALGQDEVIERAVNRLKRRAAEAWEGAFVALHAPVAPKTWETRVRYLSSEPESNLGKINFPRAVEVVGFIPTVVPVSFAPAPPLVFATLDDLVISIAWDQETKVTSVDVNLTTTAAEEAFVTASTTSILLPRLIGLRLTTPQPQLQIKWRWKQGPGVFVDSIVSLAAAVRFL